MFSSCNVARLRTTSRTKATRIMTVVCMLETVAGSGLKHQDFCGRYEAGNPLRAARRTRSGAFTRRELTLSVSVQSRDLCGTACFLPNAAAGWHVKFAYTKNRSWSFRIRGESRNDGECPHLGGDQFFFLVEGAHQGQDVVWATGEPGAGNAQSPRSARPGIGAKS